MGAKPAEQGSPNCERLEHEVAALKARIEELERLLEEALRRGKRQAALFSKGTQKKEPKRPGHKQGKDYGQHQRRAVPDLATVDETHDVPLPARLVGMAEFPLRDVDRQAAVVPDSGTASMPRQLHCLVLELECEPPGGRALIVWPDENGNRTPRGAIRCSCDGPKGGSASPRRPCATKSAQAARPSPGLPRLQRLVVTAADQRACVASETERRHDVLVPLESGPQFSR